LWYVDAVTESVPKLNGIVVEIVLRTADPVWKSKEEQSVTWNITASGQTKVVTVDGNYPALPVFTLSPTAAKAAGFNYRRWCAILNQTDYELPNYPIEITGGWDTETLVLASKMQASGNDLRVSANGIEVTRWLNGINTDSTSVWIVLGFAPRVALTLGTAIAGAGAVEKIYFEATAANDEALARLPGAGILLIGTEAFNYDGKDAANRCVSVTSRAFRDTTAAAHDVAVAVNWVQYDILINFGDAALGAPAVDNTRKPAFSLASTNDQWIYDTIFGDLAGLRAGSWSRSMLRNIWMNGFIYTGHHKEIGTDPMTHMGQGVQATADKGNSVWIEWSLYNPCGMDLVNAAGDNAAGGYTDIEFYLETLSSIPGAQWVILDAPVMTWQPGGIWYSWTIVNEAPAAGTTKIRFHSLLGLLNGVLNWIAIETTAVTVDIVNPPTVLFIGEASNYTLACVLENETTGESLAITASMQLGAEDLIIDTREKTIYLAGGIRAPVSRIMNTIRSEWLRLVPGANTLKFTDVGTDTVDITIEFEERNL